MPSYIYTQKPHGHGVSIVVHRIKNNKPHFIGGRDYDTAGWPGKRGAAIDIIVDKEGFKRNKYGLVRKDIVLSEI